MTKYDNSGALFKNARKEKDTHPDYEGSITVNGVEYWLKSWLKQGAKGTSMSLSVTPKQERAQEIRRNAGNSKNAGNAGGGFGGGGFVDDLDDAIPF